MRHARSDYDQSDVERFWSFVDRAQGENACWLWQGGVSGSGYGVFTLNAESISAHVFAHLIQHGALAEGQVVRHFVCHNRLCMNGAHLTGGTQQQNIDDMKAAGRQSRGSKRYNAKLSDENVREILRACEAGESTRALARRFGVCQATIAHVTRGAAWQHVSV